MIEKLFPSVAWDAVYFGNTLGAYLDALIFFVLLVLGFYVLQRIILKRLRAISQKTETDVDDVAIKIIDSIHPPAYYFLSFYIASHTLVIGEIAQKSIFVIVVVMIVYQIVSSIQILINYIAQKTLGNKDGDEQLESAVNMLSMIAKVIIWILGGLLIMSNLGINVSALVASLGIGGIAIAFALQGILGDLFASFSIYFDKPFVVGDFITNGANSGTVEKIGIKTTRIRSITGEQIVISNKELTETRVQNFTEMEERRVTSSVGVTYETSSATLKEIPAMIAKIVEDTKGVRFDRVHFKKFDDSSLGFEFVYFVESSAYPDHMDAQQKINYAIREKFETEKIEIAYPTRTLYTKNI